MSRDLIGSIFDGDPFKVILATSATGFDLKCELCLSTLFSNFIMKKSSFFHCDKLSSNFISKNLDSLYLQLPISMQHFVDKFLKNKWRSMRIPWILSVRFFIGFIKGFANGCGQWFTRWYLCNHFHSLLRLESSTKQAAYVFRNIFII